MGHPGRADGPTVRDGHAAMTGTGDWTVTHR